MKKKTLAIALSLSLIFSSTIILFKPTKSPYTQSFRPPIQVNDPGTTEPWIKA